MSDKTDNGATGRRDFLKLAGLGTLASGATLVSGQASAAEAPQQGASGYRETEHVKRAYETARF